MNRTTTVAICAAAAALGLAGGYSLRVGTQTLGADGGSGASSVPENDGNLSTKSPAPRAVTNHAAQVKENAERSRGARHWLHWMAGVENAGVADLPGLARMAKDNPGALRMIAYRWIELDPHDLFQTLLREAGNYTRDGEELFPGRRLAEFLFEEWPKLDPEAAVAALSGEAALPGQSSLRHSVLNTVAGREPKLAFELMAKWGIHNFGFELDAVKEWARRDPAEAARAALAYPVGYGAKRSMEAIAQEWARMDPEAAIHFAAQASGLLSGPMRDAVLAEWASRDLDAASAWLAAQDDESLRNRLSPLLVEAWAKEEAEAALAWCEENLDGHRLIAAVSKLATGAAEKDKDLAAELIVGMTPSPARTEAAAALAQTWFPRFWPSDQGVAPEAVAWLRGLNDRELQGAILEKVAWGWGTQDREGLIEILGSDHALRAPDSVYHTLMRSFARDDPQRALEWASGLPPERIETASTSAFTVWMGNQPVAASEWLIALPAEDSRRAPLMASFISESIWQPEPVALQRLGLVPGDHHAEVRAQVARSGISAEKKTKLLSALGPAEQ